MQDRETVYFSHYSDEHKYKNYENYLIYNGRLVGHEVDIELGANALFEILTHFYSSEVIRQGKDISELGKYLDYHYMIYKEPFIFLKFFYESFFPIYKSGIYPTPLNEFSSALSLNKVTCYVIEWLAKNMENPVVNNDTEKGLVIREMYSTIQLKRGSTPIGKTPSLTKKQPIAKVVMAFVNLIDMRASIIPKNSINNDAKFNAIALRINELFGYSYSGNTLEKEQYSLDGYSLDVYNLLVEWEYGQEALRYKNRHGL